MANEATVSIKVILKDAATAGLTAIKGAFEGLRSALTSTIGVLAQLGLAFGFGETVKYIIETNAEMEQLRVRLNVFAQSTQEAALWWDQLHHIAERTPFTLKEVSEAFIQLRLVGITPTTAQLQGLIDHAAASGMSIVELADIVRLGTAGMYRGFHQLGIQIKDEHDHLAATFHGVTTNIGKDAESILNYLTAIEKKQFAGAAAKQLDTLSGSWTQLKKALEDAALAIGKAGLNKALVDLAHTVTDFINSGGSKNLLDWASDVAHFFRQAWEGLEVAIKGLTTLGRLVKDLVTGDLEDAKKAMTELGDAMLKLTEDEANYQMRLIARAIEARNNGGKSGRITPSGAAGFTSTGNNSLEESAQKDQFVRDNAAAHAAQFAAEAAAMKPVLDAARDVFNQLDADRLNTELGIVSADILGYMADWTSGIEGFSHGLQAAVADMGDLSMTTADLAEMIGGEFMNAFQSAFTAIGSGQKTLAQGLKQIMGQTLGAIANQMGKMEIAKATSAFADFLITKDPSQLAGGLKHMAAAALFFAVGGAASGMGGGGGGGGGGGAGSAITGTNNVSGDQKPATLVLQGGAVIDTNNPDHLDALADALAALSGRRIIIKTG